MVLAAEKILLRSVPWCSLPSDTCCGRARGCARLQLVWIDRVFPGLSNGVSLVSFAHLVSIKELCDIPFNGILYIDINSLF